MFVPQYGRVLSVCAPRDRRYRVAVVKVIGQKRDAIVCDTSRTACLAIEYLKQHRLPPQTFLPLDGLQVTKSIGSIDR